MVYKKKTIFSLFSSGGMSFFIPDYQRAYSWEKEQCEQFFNDLYEQSKSENNYYLGNIIVEKNNFQLEIVDGQQRMTTVIIFIRAFINICSERMKSEKNKINLSELKKKYIGSSGNLKLNPCKIDRDYFEALIINNKSIQTKSQSQEKIKYAKNYFIRKLKTIKLFSELLKILEKLQESIITITTIDDKTDSAFMFELMNNRGRVLTEMERVKAYLMYQIYINDKKSSVKNKIKKISMLFGEIYLFLNDIKNINEDDLLWYHCNAYYGYCYIDDNYDTIVEFLKEQINEITEKPKKIEFISNFVKELRQTFSDIHEMEKSKNIGYLKRICLLGIPRNLYPFIINGYRYMKKDDKIKYFEKLFHLLELLSFRLEIIPRNGNVKLNKRFDNILNFQGDINTLYKGIRSNFIDDENEYRWTDDAMYEVLRGPVFKKVTDNAIHYIFKIYENKISGGDFPKLKKISIEHISPQTFPPPNVKDTGYEKLPKKNDYSIKFKNQYLHCIGNLMLSAGKQQNELSNKKFVEKLKIYNQNKLGLKHQTELKKYFENSKKVKWGIAEIEKRRNALIDFIFEQWSFRNKDKYFLVT